MNFSRPVAFWIAVLAAVVVKDAAIGPSATGNIEHAGHKLSESGYRPVDDLLGFDVADDIERGIAAMWSSFGAAH
jgi:hypothetical protein